MRQLIDSLECRRLLASGFQIDVSYEASVSTSVRSVIQQAVTRWQQVITGDVPDVGSGLWGAPVDDIRITARVKSIDGSGNGVAQARPLFIRNTTHLPIAGEIEIDSSDVAAQTAAGTLLSIVTHEIGHALGFGTTWAQYIGLTTGRGGSNPLFHGANALREYRAASGLSTATGVPLENTGSAGTRDAHWRETTFRTEIMTGTIGAGANPLSRITIGQFQDLGYSVNYNAADAFSLISNTTTAITGNVFNDANSSGTKNTGEANLSGVRIYIDSNFNNAFDGSEKSVFTDSNGNYTLNVAAGGHQVRSVPPSGGVMVFPATGSHWVNVSNGQTVGGKNFAIRTGSTPPPPTPTGTAITGNVFNDANSNGRKDSGEGNLSGVRIYIDSNYNNAFDSTERSVLTDSNGNYTLNVAAGGNQLRSVVPSGGVMVFPATGSHWVTVSSGQTVSGKNFAIRTGSTPPPPTPTVGSISGTVFKDANRNGQLNTGEVGLGGYTIFLDTNYNGIRDANEKFTTSSSNGSYALTGVAAGGYNVMIVLGGSTIVQPSLKYWWVTLGVNGSVSGKNFAIA